MRAHLQLRQVRYQQVGGNLLTMTSPQPKAEGVFGRQEGKVQATEILHSLATRNQTENTLGIKEFGIGRSFCGPQVL